MPKIIFDYYGPLMVMTYFSLALECTCFLTVWPQATRLPTLLAILALHIGIELAMNMHCFEWLVILGWLFFFVEPSAEATANAPSIPLPRRIATNLFLVFILSTFAIDTAPLYEIMKIAPPWSSDQRFRNSFDSSVSLAITLLNQYFVQLVWNRESGICSDLRLMNQPCCTLKSDLRMAPQQHGTDPIGVSTTG